MLGDTATCWQKTVLFMGLSCTKKQKGGGTKPGGSLIRNNCRNWQVKVVVCVSDKKWEHMKELIDWIDKEAKSEMVDFKELENARGYLIHIVGTYP